MQWFFLSQFILKYMIFIHNHFILSITNNKKYRKKGRRQKCIYWQVSKWYLQITVLPRVIIETALISKEIIPPPFMQKSRMHFCAVLQIIWCI